MIEIRNVSMDYGAVRAVDGVTFSVNKGEIVGLLGPNGAGKTTLMKIIATHIVPTKGTAVVAGVDVREDPQRVRSRLGYLPEQAPLYDNMEVREYLEFVARSRGLNGNSRSRLEWVRERCGLEKVWCTPIGQLSKGYRQRTGIAQALVHDPPVLILDEPTSGLDPIQIIEIRELVKELAQDKAILFSTHILQEITAVTQRIVVINQGRVMADSTLDHLVREHTESEKVVVGLDAAGDPTVELERLDGVRRAERLQGGKTSRFRLHTAPGGDVLGAVAELCHHKGWKIVELYRERPDLEEVFLSIVSGRDGAAGA